MAKKPFTIYRTIRIDGEYDTAKVNSANDALETAIAKALNDARSHTYTVEDGVEVSDITDCGEPV